jgi:hypothetical protein
LNTSVASTSFSWADNAEPSCSTICKAVSVVVRVFIVVLDVFARLVVVATSLLDFVFLRTGFSGTFDDPRRRVWRDNTVASEHVDVDRTACLMDSDIVLGGKTVTAMARRKVGGWPSQ